MTKQSTNPIKRIKIDEHIKSATKNSPIKKQASENIKSDAGIKRGRGRPRKNTQLDDNAPKISGSGLSPSLMDSNGGNQGSNPADSLSGSPNIKPIYDTTEEAKGVLQAPFEVAAGLTGCEKLRLSESQVFALAPSFKVVYDKRIAPYLGENADIYAFGMVFVGILFGKVTEYKEWQKTQVKKTETNYYASMDADIKPQILTEHHA